MAPLPPSSTVRVFVDYTSLGIPHTAEVRLSGSPTIGVMETAALGAANAMYPFMFETDAVTGARYSPVGEDFTLPLTFSPIAGSKVAGFAAQWAEDPESAMVSVVGRGSSTARRWRFCLFTPYAWANSSVTWPAKNRYLPGVNSQVDAFYDAVTTFLDAIYGSGTRVVSIGGDTVAPNAYVNIRKNSYWQDKQRNT